MDKHEPIKVVIDRATHTCMWANRKDGDKIYIGVDLVENGELLCLNPSTIRLRSDYEEDEKTCICAITNNMATMLMTDLWRAGIRPAEGKNDEDRD